MVGQTTLLAVRQMSAEATSMMRQIPTVTNSTPVFSCRSGGRELDVRKLSSSASRGEVFFLDIPFYRTRPFGLASRPNVLQRVAPAQTLRVMRRVVRPQSCAAQSIRAACSRGIPDPQSDPPMSGPTGDLMRAKWSQKIPPGQGSILDGRCGAILGLVFAQFFSPLFKLNLTMLFARKYAWSMSCRFASETRTGITHSLESRSLHERTRGFRTKFSWRNVGSP